MPTYYNGKMVSGGGGGGGGGWPAAKTRLTISAPIAVGMNYSTIASGPNYVHSGDLTTVGVSAAVMLASHNIMILLNGVEKDKNTEITWINATTFQIVTPAQNAGDIITIYN